jgi:hypothetical protein
VTLRRAGIGTDLVRIPYQDGIDADQRSAAFETRR